MIVVYTVIKILDKECFAVLISMAMLLVVKDCDIGAGTQNKTNTLSRYKSDKHHQNLAHSPLKIKFNNNKISSKEIK